VTHDANLVALAHVGPQRGTLDQCLDIVTAYPDPSGLTESDRLEMPPSHEIAQRCVRGAILLAGLLETYEP
jgi:hypothetical protein